MARAGILSRHLPSPPGHGRAIPTTVVDETVAAAGEVLDKWHPDDNARSLFLDSPEEADAFLRAAATIHRAMHFYASRPSAANVRRGGQLGLVQAQTLVDTAMRRLQLELQLLLSSLPGADDLDFHDYDDNQQATTGHLREVAEAMVAAGYGKECVSTFKARRRESLSGTLQRTLGFSPAAQLGKLAWEQVDARMQSWLAGAPAAFESVFPLERELCGSVFAADAAVADAVFASIAGDHATGLLAVAEAAVARARNAPERLFRVLDVHDALTETMLPAIVPVFGNKSEVTSRAVALAMTKLPAAARSMVASFEAAIHKEPSKATTAGGGVHPLTRYVMNYLAFLADYEGALARIYQQGEFADTPSLFSGSASSSSLSLSSNPIGWLVFVLLQKLDAKAGSYRDREAALSYLFLANNTHYVAKKVAGSGKLRAVLGGEWAEAQTAKARGYVELCVRASWGSKVVPALRGGEGAEVALMEAAAAQRKWVAADEGMGEALRAAARAVLVPTYLLFYRRHGAAVRLTPGDVNAMIGRLFGGQQATAGPSDGRMVIARKQSDVAPKQNPRWRQLRLSYIESMAFTKRKAAN